MAVGIVSEAPPSGGNDLQAAEEMLSALGSQINRFVGDDLRAIGESLALLEEGGCDVEAAAFRLQTASHNIKGIAGSLGYGLLSDLAQRLSLLCEQAPLSPRLPVVARLCLEAMTAIVDNRVTGLANGAGDDLITSLESLSALIAEEAAEAATG